MPSIPSFHVNSDWWFHNGLNIWDYKGVNICDDLRWLCFTVLIFICSYVCGCVCFSREYLFTVLPQWRNKDIYNKLEHCLGPVQKFRRPVQVFRGPVRFWGSFTPKFHTSNTECRCIFDSPVHAYSRDRGQVTQSCGMWLDISAKYGLSLARSSSRIHYSEPPLIPIAPILS